MTTEIVRVHCNLDRIPNDPNSEASQNLKAGLEVLSKREGFQRMYWGLEVENPDVFRLFVDWDSVESHKKFMNDPSYGPFTEQMAFVLDFKTLNFFYVPFTPHPPTSALSHTSSPVTEIITVYFPADYSSSDQDTFVSNLQPFIDVIQAAPTCHGSAGGWATEDGVIPGTEEKAKVYVVVIGWDTVEAHMAFRETQGFKDHRHRLRGAKGLKHIEVVHAGCTEIGRGGGV